jgi:D-amino-acid oxidase
MNDVLVLGAGVIGLTAAIELQRRGRTVTIWTRDDPLATTSAVAAAIWYPFLAEPRARVLAWSKTTFDVLQRLAADPATGTTLVTTRELFATDAPDLWWLPAVRGARRLPAHELPPGYRAGVDVEVPLCDTRVYLPWLLQRFHAAGGRLERRAIADLSEAIAPGRTVVNCTGLGARELCRDADLHAVRGQVLRLPKVPLRRALIDDTGERPCYVLPRSADVVVGGTTQHGDERQAPDDRDTAAILAAARAHLPELAGVEPAAVAVGLRPCRSAVRLEAEVHAGGTVVHAYGHGGSGFTLAWGCAAEVADLVCG